MEKEEQGGERREEKGKSDRTWKNIFALFKYSGLFIMWHFSVVNIKHSGQFSRLTHFKYIYVNKFT